MAITIRHESHIVNGNCYTATVYNKGTEAIRIYKTILGGNDFRKEGGLYFERQAVSWQLCSS